MDERQEWLNRQRQRWETDPTSHPVHACGCLPPSAPPTLADSWRDTGNRGAAEHLARLKPER